jgi:hypothetical protein
MLALICGAILAGLAIIRPAVAGLRLCQDQGSGSVTERFRSALA